MSIGINTQCLECHLRRNLETARSLGDEKTAMAFARELMKLYASAPEGVSSPWLGPHTTALLDAFYGIGPDRFREEKQQSNAFALERMDSVRTLVQQAADPVYAGLQFAVLGNYLDFSALQGKVSFKQLDEMLMEALTMELDRDCYAALCRDLRDGKKLLYLTDNAGEIVFDRIFAEQIAQKYPNLQITFCVRGGPAANDATREDAHAVGVPFPVIDNGNTVGGTELSLLSRSARQALEEADVVIAKGMGNTETMYGCGFNVYYAFLVKCIRFVQQFEKPLMTPLFVRERK